MRFGLVAACLGTMGCFDFDRALVTCMQKGGCATPWTVVVTSDGGLATDVPLLIPLGGAQAAAVVNPDTDLRFVDDATADWLPFEVAHWDAGSGGAVWLTLPRLDGRATLTLVTGPQAHGAADAGAVWQGWELVHHFESPRSSSSDGRYRATRIGVQTRAGVVGEAPYFSGTGEQRVTFDGGEALFDGWGQFTLAFWLFPDYPTPGSFSGEPGFLDKGVALSLGRLIHPGTDPLFQIDMHFTGANDTFLGAGFGVRRWNFIVYAFDGEWLRVYVDGQEQDSAQMTGGPQQLLSSNDHFFLGDQGMPIAGLLDELWIDRKARDANWVFAAHRSVTGAMVTVTRP